MKNPIIYSEGEKQYIVWLSYWGAKIMKYFSSPEEAIDYIKLNPKRCMGFKKAATKDELDLWLSELKALPTSEDKTVEMVTNEVGSKKNPSNTWLYVLAFVVIFIINSLSNPKGALVTLISSITQAVILVIVVGGFRGLKKLLKRNKQL